MHALTLLKNDHAKVKALLGELEAFGDRRPRERERLFGRIRTELTVHEIIEEEIFYPALRTHPKAKGIVLEGIEEHNVVDTLLGELATLPPDDETWAPKAKVMKENVEHHIGEEEDEMFAAARRVFDRSELDDLGAQMEDRKASARRDVEREEGERDRPGG